MTARSLASQALGWCLGLVFTAYGCGSVHYSHHARAATRHLEQARLMEAGSFAPYEYEMARRHLEKSHEEAGKAEYQDAVELARESNAQAKKAIVVTRERRAQAGERETER